MGDATGVAIPGTETSLEVVETAVYKDGLIASWTFQHSQAAMDRARAAEKEAGGPFEQSKPAPATESAPASESETSEAVIVPPTVEETAAPIPAAESSELTLASERSKEVSAPITANDNGAKAPASEVDTASETAAEA